MKIGILALSAISALGCLKAAQLPTQSPVEAPLAIYYSFDTPPPGGVFTEMQSEMDRILAPANLRVAWRSTDTQNTGAEDFPDIVVFRFHGRCSLEANWTNEEFARDPGGLALARTQITDGHVLPFGEVDCDKLRYFLAPAAKSMDATTRNSALGRAMARVSAHEIYHMLTGSETHAATGIARPSHSRTELTAQTFSFAEAETEWLRAWVERQTRTTQEEEAIDEAEPPVALAGR
jgi:hypothetical protein